jgi:hypothetical protein
MGNPETILKTDEVEIGADPRTGCVISSRLYGRELLDPAAPPHELLVNGTPLDLRATPHSWTNIAPYPQSVVGPAANEMHGCHFTGHYTGWGLDVTRALRARSIMERRNGGLMPIPMISRTTLTGQQTGSLRGQETGDESHRRRFRPPFRSTRRR